MRIGLFFSRINGLIDQEVDLHQLTAEYGTKFLVSVYDDFLAARGFRQMLADIRANSLDGVILIGESPVTFSTVRGADQLIQKIESLGLNPNKIGFVNLKKQVVLVHQGNREKATLKAKLLIDVEIERVKLAEPLQVVQIPPRKAVAIIGATEAGLLTAQKMLQRGYAVSLLERTRSSVGDLFQQDDQLKPVVALVENHPKFKSYLNVNISDLYGYAGDYTLELSGTDGKILLSAGAIVVANMEDRLLTQILRPLLHIDIDEQNFFKPRNRATLQAYSTETGIFLVRNTADLNSIANAADSAALAIGELLSRAEIPHIVAVSDVNDQRCGGCGICVKTCMFHACKVDPVNKIAVIDPKRCKGCGNCVAACPTGARDLLTYPKQYLVKAIDILAQYGAEQEKTLMFLCEGCGYQALDTMGDAGTDYPVSVLPLKIRCGGTLDTQLILHAFHQGFDGVIVCKCPEGHCSNIVGNVDLDRRANLFRQVLKSRGIDTERLRIVEAVQGECEECAQAIAELYEDLQTMGVS